MYVFVYNSDRKVYGYNDTLTYCINKVK